MENIMMLDLPTNAAAFVRFMESVWEPIDWDLYDRFHNAIRTAKVCGMIRTGTTNAPNGEWAGVYRFVDEMQNGVVIHKDGDGCYLAHNAYGQHK
jgi:hypothetical protein